MPKSEKLTVQADEGGYNPVIFGSGSLVEAEAIAPPGYERLDFIGGTRTLRLVAGEPIELIFGYNHKIKLRKGDDGVVGISIDGFQLLDSRANGDGAPRDELIFPANMDVVISRDSEDDELAEEKTSRIKAYQEQDQDGDVFYSVKLPDQAVNLQGKKIDFTDTDEGDIIDISLMENNEVEITNYDTGLGIAVPLQQPESVDLSRSEAGPNSWNGEMAGMLKNPAARTAYENFMNQPGAAREVAMIIAVAAYLYQDQLKAMGKEGFTSMVKGIRAALPKI